MRLLILIITFFVSQITVGQKSYKPTIAVLDPFQTKYDTILSTKIDEYTYEAVISLEEEKKIVDSLKNGENNIQVMDIAAFHFSKKMNFGSYFTLSINTMLSYMVFGQTENCIVIPSHDIANGETIYLKSLADKHKVQWIVNPVFLNVYIKDGNQYLTARIQIFDRKKNKIVLDKEYTGDTENPGFELSCESGTLECTVNNVINSSLNDILLAILGRYQH